MNPKQSSTKSAPNLSQGDIAAIAVGAILAVVIVALAVALALLIPAQNSTSSSITASSSSSIASSSAASSSSLPLVFRQQGPSLQGEVAIGNGQQGTSVELSGDGNTLVVGAPFDSGNVGSTWVFERTNGTWNQTAKLVGTGNTGNQLQGSSVAVSFDGNTIAVGSPTDGTTPSGVFVFVRSGSSWIQQGNEITAAFPIGNAKQGASVALSSDGNRLAFGGPADNSNAGAVWVFNRTGSTWTEQVKITGIGSSGSNMGSSISFSLDGTIIATGGPNDSGGAGATWIFTNFSSGWLQPVPKLVGSGAQGNANQGLSVHLSGDGTTLLIGGPGDNLSRGAVWYFENVSNTWTERQKIPGPVGVTLEQFGSGVGSNTDGSSIVIGAPYGSPPFGYGFVFTKSANTFLFEQLLSPQVPSLYGGNMGFSASMNSTGDTIALGSPLEPMAASVGKSYVFVK